MKHIFAFALACLLTSACAAVKSESAAAGPSAAPAPLLSATYRFEDGGCVTGGQFNEGGDQRLLFMDVWSGGRGGLFERQGDQAVSVVGDGASLAFLENGHLIDWTSGGETSRARRIHAGDPIDAKFQSDELTLRGTLFIPPHARADFPAIVLAHGSGDVDRHAGPWISFFIDLGFAVLTYDKRGVGASEGDRTAASFNDLARDLSSAVDWLAAEPHIDGRQIGIATTSQSGWYGPAVARANGRVAFLIQRAGPGTPVGPTTLHEMMQEWRADGLSSDAIASARAFRTQLYDLISANASAEHGQALLSSVVQSDWFEPAFGDWTRINEDWWRRQVVNASYDPAGTAGDLSIPVLWFLAEADENVPFEESRVMIAAAQRANAGITLVTLRGADHAFLVRTEDGVSFTDQYWPVMADWLQRRGFTQGLNNTVAACRNEIRR